MSRLRIANWWPRLVSTAVFFSLSAVSGLGAQDAPPPWVHMSVVDVEPSLVDEFMAVQLEISALAKKAQVPWRHVSRTEVFGNPNRFLIASPSHDLASLGAEANQSAELQKLSRRMSKYVTDETSYAVLMLHDIANALPEGEMPGVMVVNMTRVAPGRELEYLKIMTSDFLPHFDEAKVHHVTGSLTFGGESGFVHLFFMKDFAELDLGSPVMRALGTDGAQQVSAKLAGIMTRSEQWIARVLPDLSFGPDPKASDQK